MCHRTQPTNQAWPCVKNVSLGAKNLCSAESSPSRSSCYIITEWFFFYFNNFSLIIFYHSVWLGFEQFGLRVQVCSRLVQFTLVRKGYDNHHFHNKSLTGKEAGVWMTSCPEETGWEFEDFKNHVSWVPSMVWRSWVLTMVWRNWDWTTRCAGCWGVVSIVWYERLLRIVSEVHGTESSPLYLNMYMFVIDMAI